MSCRLSELVLNCRDPETLSRFWCAVLGYVELGREGADIEIGPTEGFGGPAPTIVLALVADQKTIPLRLHLDVKDALIFSGVRGGSGAVGRELRDDGACLVSS